MTAAILLSVLALAGPPLPEHPVTGKPVQPSWSYSYPTVSKDGKWRLRCFVPVQGPRRCYIVGRR